MNKSLDDGKCSNSSIYPYSVSVQFLVQNIWNIAMLNKVTDWGYNNWSGRNPRYRI